ncbi:pyridoxamine 5'-phosphate oxidase family protein [Nocardia sp. BMG51109]|uniref:pyridoxamine 5'-phosphate oxidase family protein n=1 Tax=Nocardia sp. BMG51109 TaxID=1056816 RepID=UPI0004654097|nr:pyridoxamine 5'-phosphate oxidase family protein [Nocardia sp. BMG51109]
MGRYAHLAYTDSVREVQRENGSAAAVERPLRQGADPEPLLDNETAFIESRDGFYLASVSETGWPYLQFRGGPPGFAHVLDQHTLGFADVRGNRQYITTGNVRADGRVALFLMDYPNRMRLKIFGRATTHPLTENPALTERLCSVRTDGRPERLVVIRVEGCNWNCHQHITPRYTPAELEAALTPIREKLTALEEENSRLRAQLPATP